MENLDRERRRKAFINSLTPREKVAFTIGVHLGKGRQFPPAATLDALRQKLGDDRSELCRSCHQPLPLRPPGARGRPPVHCPDCRPKLHLLNNGDGGAA